MEIYKNINIVTYNISYVFYKQKNVYIINNGKNIFKKKEFICEYIDTPERGQ